MIPAGVCACDCAGSKSPSPVRLEPFETQSSVEILTIGFLNLHLCSRSGRCRMSGSPLRTCNEESLAFTSLTSHFPNTRELLDCPSLCASDKHGFFRVSRRTSGTSLHFFLSPRVARARKPPSCAALLTTLLDQLCD